MPETLGLFNNPHSIQVSGMIYNGSRYDVDEEIIFEGPNMSPKSHVDEEIILEGHDIPHRSNIPERVGIAPSVVSHPTKVSPQTSVKSTTKI